MNVIQAIQNPLGVTVFGSAVLRVEPDIASLNFTVSRLEQHPKDAFAATRKAVQKVSEYLAQAGIEDVGSSRINLSQSYRYVGGENTFLGYEAEVTFHLTLTDLERIEEILVGVVDEGVNEIHVDFRTTRLKELRMDARRHAILAAREKAEVYCEAAGVTVGAVLHIEDVNPDQLRGHEQNQKILRSQTLDDGLARSFDPGSIAVNGAVMVAFAIEQ
jgi:uncharacterized protein YggE